MSDKIVKKQTLQEVELEYKKRAMKVNVVDRRIKNLTEQIKILEQKKKLEEKKIRNDVAFGLPCLNGHITAMKQQDKKYMITKSGPRSEYVEYVNELPTPIPYWKTEAGKAAAKRYREKKKLRE